MRFEKTGTMRYISHLDLSRMFSRSLARAGIEAAHTEGFNPHPKISFASALPLGVESLCEFADAKIKGDTGAKILEKAKGAFPAGLNIAEAYEPERGFADIDRARFHIFVKPEGFGIREIEELFEGGAQVEKKPGGVIGGKDYICEMGVSMQGGCMLLDAVAKTNAQLFLNPENIIKAISAKFAADEYFIRKIEAYDIGGNVFR
jgi:radical SAM-linked protein